MHDQHARPSAFALLVAIEDSIQVVVDTDARPAAEWHAGKAQLLVGASTCARRVAPLAVLSEFLAQSSKAASRFNTGE